MYNIHNFMTEQEENYLIEHLVRVTARTNRRIPVLVMDKPDLARRIKARLGDKAYVIYRKYFAGGGDDNAQDKVSPEQWLATYAADIAPGEGIYYYANNEPNASQKTFDWLYSVADLTRRAGGRVVLGNFSVGVPEPAAWSRSVALLRLMEQYPDRLIMGVHEYIPTLWRYAPVQPNPMGWPAKVDGAGDLLGRYRHLFKFCDAQRIKRPLIIITETGFDRIHAVGQWQQGLKRAPGCDIVGPLWCNVPQWEEWIREYGIRMSWQGYAAFQLYSVHHAIWRHDPEVLGFTQFCWGARGGSAWEGFDVKNLREYHQFIEQADWSKPMSSNPIIPGTQLEARRAVIDPAVGLDFVNIRDSPTVSAADRGDVRNGDVFEVYVDSTATANGYTWRRVKMGATGSGWVANVNGLTWRALDTAPPVDPKLQIAVEALLKIREITGTALHQILGTPPTP